MPKKPKSEYGVLPTKEPVKYTPLGGNGAEVGQKSEYGVLPEKKRPERPVEYETLETDAKKDFKEDFKEALEKNDASGLEKIFLAASNDIERDELIKIAKDQTEKTQSQAQISAVVKALHQAKLSEKARRTKAAILGVHYFSNIQEARATAKKLENGKVLLWNSAQKGMYVAAFYKKDNKLNKAVFKVAKGKDGKIQFQTRGFGKKKVFTSIETLDQHLADSINKCNFVV